MAVSLTALGPACVVARCEDPEDLQPERQETWAAALRSAARQVPRTGLLLDLGEGIRSLDAGASASWLRLARDPESKLGALAASSRALAVRAAIRGFGLAQEVLGTQVQAEVFPSLERASAWVQEAVTRATVRAPLPDAVAIPAADGAEAVVWGQAVEGLGRAIGIDRDPDLMALLAELGFDLRKRPAASYPREAFLSALDLIATRRWGELPADQAMVELGRAWVHGFDQTLVGRAMLAFVRALGPRRAVQRLTQSLRTANNYTDATSTEVASTHFEVKLKPVFRPGFFTGILTAGLEVTGAQEPMVSLKGIRDLEATYTLRWSSKQG